jgi:riboflavin kinase / FMN adenylyltransferase
MKPSTPDNNTCKSTSVERLLAEGNTIRLLTLLGRAWSLGGEVVEGNKIGRTLGYPTANLHLEKNHPGIPGQGVYAAMVSVENTWYAAMANIGIRPTLDLEQVTVEAHLFDFDGDLYGKYIVIHFLNRIRDEMRFSSLSELKDQLDHDRRKSLQLLADMKEQLLPSDGVLMYVKSS